MIGKLAYLEQSQADDVINPNRAAYFKTDIT